MDTLNELYKEIEQRYSILSDIDHEAAFELMKMTSSLQASYESKLAVLNKEQLIQEKRAKAVHARVSRESSTKVNEGERIANSSPEVLKEWELYADIIQGSKLMESAIKFLSRVYFDCKLIYENCCRVGRQPAGEEKFVGRF